MGVVVVGPDVGLAVVRVCSCGRVVGVAVVGWEWTRRWTCSCGRVVGVVFVGFYVGLDVGLAVVGQHLIFF